jgi:hypothetical protein
MIKVESSEINAPCNMPEFLLSKQGQDPKQETFSTDDIFNTI